MVKPELKQEDVIYYVNAIAKKQSIESPQPGNYTQATTLLELIKTLQTGMQLSYQAENEMEFLKEYDRLTEHALQLAASIYPLDILVTNEVQFNPKVQLRLA